MTDSTLHNPDRYMGDLRQILSQGKKRVGLLLGAGAPTAVRVDDKGHVDINGRPLIPDVARLTEAVIKNLESSDQKLIEKLKTGLGEKPNIETILTKIRRLAQAIGDEKVHGLNGAEFGMLASRICAEIGIKVSPLLPSEPNAFAELISWIGGTHRDHPVEIFTPNYDLLLEEAFERARLPFFDGFTGAYLPFFDPASVSEDKLPARWSRIWKLHGSLGWDAIDQSIVRTGNRKATQLIYPDHLKYDEITRQPYSALFDRLRQFLTTPDSLLICSGFSFFDSHICAVLDEALSANTHTAVFAFQFRNLADEGPAIRLALNRPNLSVYARDGAVIFGLQGRWQPGQLPNEEWQGIRETFWKFGVGQDPNEFLLGDFAKLARFCALTQASKMQLAPAVVASEGNQEGTAPSIGSALE